MVTPRRITMVMRPTIRMSLDSSTIRASLSRRISRTVSAKPTTYIAVATALAIEKMTPMEPPNSGPRLRDIR